MVGLNQRHRQTVKTTATTGDVQRSSKIQPCLTDSIHQRRALLGEASTEKEAEDNDEFKDDFWQFIKPEERIRLRNMARQNLAQSSSSSTTTDRSQPLLSSEATKDIREKLSSAMTSRFTKASSVSPSVTSSQSSGDLKYGLMLNEELSQSQRLVEQTKKELVPSISTKQPQASSKQATRQIFDWYPEALLCKRLNIPNPKPDAPIKGTQGVLQKSKSTSIFDNALFDSLKLSAQSLEPTAVSQEPQPLQQSSNQNIEKIATTQRPSMDMFKSVFGDDEESQETVHEPESQTVLPTINETEVQSEPEEDDAFPFEMIKQQQQQQLQQPQPVPHEPLPSSRVVDTGASSKLAKLQAQIAQVKRLLGEEDNSSSSSSSDEEERRRKRKKEKKKEKKRRREDKHEKKRKKKRYYSSSSDSDSHDERHRRRKDKSKSNNKYRQH